MNLERDVRWVEIDFNKHKHIYSKNVLMIIFPTNIAKIQRALMYVEANGYRHPVVVNNNHFTLPIKLLKITKERSALEKIRLLSITSENGYHSFIGWLTLDKKRNRYCLTIDKKIREVLQLKERDIIEIKIDSQGPFYARAWQAARNSMRAFLPEKILELVRFKQKVPLQVHVKKSNKKIVSNLHFYATKKANLKFENFLENKIFNLYQFLKFSYAQTRGGKIRKFDVRSIDDKVFVYYHSGGPKSKEIKLKAAFTVDDKFSRMMGLIQAEASKSIKKTFCLTNEIPQNIKYVIDWFEKNLQISRNSWLYELSLDPREMENKELAKEFWSKLLKVPSNLIKVYPKISEYTNKPKKFGIMNLRTKGRTLKEIILRLLESVRDHVIKHRIAAGYFLSGVLAGDGYIINSKKGSLHYIGISFDPNKVWDEKENELLLYIKCLEKIGIPKNHIRIYVNEHPKTAKFVKKISDYGIKTKVHKKSALGFGATLLIFRYKNFAKLLKFKPFHPHPENEKKFLLAFSKMDGRRTR